MDRRYNHLTVFTKSESGGNPLAVITEVDGLDDVTMQALARKIGLSETVFVFPPTHPAHMALIRIFTPANELPFAGHPTVGTAICLTESRIWRARGAEFDTLCVLEAKGGILRVAVRPDESGAAFAEFDVPDLPQEIGEPAPVDRIAAALSLAPTEIGFENFRPRRFSAGVPFTFVPVADIDAIARAQVVEEFWPDAFGADSHAAAYLYCRETVQTKASFHARCFVPTLGVLEDPATGSAAAAFAGVIHLYDDIPEGTYNGVIEQGMEMEFEVENRTIRNVRIGGHAIMLGERTVTL